MNVVFDPSTNKKNKYVDIMVNCLKQSGFSVLSFKEAFSNFTKFRSIKIVHLNWYENLDTKFDFIKKISKLAILRFSGKKIIWTVHNRTPHENKEYFLQKILMSILMRNSNAIVIHCKESEAIIGPKFMSKTFFIPHPNYIGVYNENIKRAESKSATLNLLFLGAVKPYKNIELLIDVIKSFKQNDIKLTIAGNPVDNRYKENILNRIQGNNSIVADLNFIEDNKMLQYIADSDLLILPYETVSSLNSGTAILSFSNYKSVICPEIGTIKEVKHKDCVLTYQYGSTQEHYTALFDKIQEALELKKSNIRIFEEWGNVMFNEVAINNNAGIIVKEISSLYKSISSYN